MPLFGNDSAGFVLPPALLTDDQTVKKPQLIPMITNMRKISTALLLFLLIHLSAAAETGLASWYGGKFHGRQTANGEIFNTYDMTAAHKTLPFNTIVKVTNTKNEKSVVVRINDRGPFVSGRIIDLSRAAAAELDMLKDGIAPVVIEVLKYSGNSPAATASKSGTIQIASFRNPEYARDLQQRLLSEGIKSTLENSGSEFIRVIISGVPENEIASLVQKLNSLGYRDLLIRQ